MLKMIKRLLIALGVIFFLFCTMVLLIRVGVVKLDSDSGKKVFNIDAEKLSSIDVSNESGDYTLVIDGEKIYLEGFEDRNYDSTEIGGIVETCRKLYAYDIIEKDAVDLTVYGLDKPQYTATLSTTDGEYYTVYVGDMMPNNDSYYVSVSGSDTVYAVKKEYLYYYYQNSYAYLSKQINLLKETDTEYMIDDFSLTQNGEPIIEFHAYTDAEKEFYNTSNLYTITYPYNCVARDAKIIDYLNDIVTLKCARIVSTEVNDEILKENGLDNPEFLIQYTYYEEPVKIRISSIDSGISNLYIEGDNTIYSFIAQQLYLREFDIFSLVNTNQFTREVTKVERIVVNHNGNNNVYNMTWSNNALASVNLNGKDISTDSFKTFYTVLNSSRIDGLAEGEATENPALSITFKYTDASGFKNDTVTFHQINARQYLLKINGEGEFYVSSVYVDKIVNSMNALNDGESFDENW